MGVLIMGVKPLVGFGLAIFVSGLLFHMYNDVVVEFFNKYIIDFSDDYYLFSNLIWDAIPFIIIFIGIACLIFGSIGYSTTNRGN